METFPQYTIASFWPQVNIFTAEWNMICMYAYAIICL